MSIRQLQTLSDILPRYRALILDLWGVVHDGTHLYPGVKDRLEALHEEGKKIILLSNAPRRAARVAEVMEGMGLPRALYDDIITSGEAAYRMMESQPTLTPTLSQRERGYVYIGLEKDRRILEGLPYHETDKPREAGFLLCAHTMYDNQPQSELEPLLADCLARKLPMLCVNPDMEVVRLSGERVYCAGVLAAEYERRGGTVEYFGKPHALVYEMCFKALGIPHPGPLPKGEGRNAFFAVGDSLGNDIKGGNMQGIDTCLVTGGILKGTA